MYLSSLVSLGFAASTSAQSIIQALDGNDATRILSANLASYPDLMSSLSGKKNYTLLAPSDSALSNFLNSTESTVLPDDWSTLASYHVLDGLYPSSAFSDMPVFIPTLLTNSSYTNVTDGQRVKIEVVDSSIIVTSGLLAKSRVVTPDIIATNGVIHIIDNVLTIPATISETALATNLTSLASALKKADLVDVVNNYSNVTIFAPNNTAFDNMTSEISKLTQGQLQRLLTNHVVGEVLYSEEFDNDELKNINGAVIEVAEANDTIKIDAASMTIRDILVANGVMHVIDGVLSSSNTSSLPPLQGGAAGSSSMAHHGLMAFSALVMAAVFAF